MKDGTDGARFDKLNNLKIGMRYTLVLYHCEKEDLSSVRCLLESLQENAQLCQGQEGVTGAADSVQVSLCPVSRDLEVIDMSTEGRWTALDSLDVESVALSADTETAEKKSQSLEDVTFLADHLHNMADNLPYTGFILDVYIINLNMEHESCLLTVGALLRLREWHKAQVRIVGALSKRHDEITRTLCEVLHASFLCRDQLSSSATRHCPAWRGDLLWPEEKGFVQQGLSLVCADQGRLRSKLMDLHFWSCRSAQKAGRAGGSDTDLVLGRQLEVLTYVDVESVPLYLFDDFSLQLHMNPHPAQSQFGQLLGTLNHKDALLLRIPLYERGSVPVASSHGLSTEAWKEGFAASEWPTPEPVEKGPLPCRQPLFLMVAGGQDVARPLMVAVLRSPGQVDPQLFEEVHRQAYFGCTHSLQAETEVDREICEAVERLPLVTAEDFRTTDDACLQALVHCLSNKKSGGDGEGPVEVTAGQLVACVQEGHEAFFQQGKEQAPLSAQEREDARNCSFICLSDLERVTSEWPERRALLDSESKAKVLRRYQSNESFNLMLSSPLGPEDSSMDAKDMVKWFKPDGNALLEDLSPVKPAVRPNRLSRCEEASLEWPACKDMQYHDVYYEHSKKSERQEQFFQKFRDTILLEESLHVCADKPRVPALRYRHHSRLRPAQMDVSCGGSKLTPIITRSSLSPSAMLQATPSAKRRLSKENSGGGSERLPEEAQKTRSKGAAKEEDVRFSAPKARVRRDRSLSSESGHSGRKRRSLESSMEGLSGKERRLLQSSFEDHSIKDGGSFKSSLEDSSFEGNVGQDGSWSSVFYPKKANPALPPFRRVSKEDVTIFSPSSSKKLSSRVASDELSGSGGNGCRKKQSSASASSEEEGSQRRLSSESVDRTTSRTAAQRKRSGKERKQRNKRRLEKVVTKVLGEAGLSFNDTLYPSCFSKLYKVSLFFAKQLPDSHNLQAELKSIAEKQVQQVVDLERRRQDLAVMKKLRKSTLVA